MATFNAGLAVGVVNLASERVAWVARAMRDVEADLVCLQEVWLDEHWDRIVAATTAGLPSALRPSPAPERDAAAIGSSTGAPACAADEVTPIASCVKRNCAHLSSDQLAACAIARCRTAAKRLSAACATCLATDPTGTLEAILEPCVGSGTQQRLGTAESRLVAYGGSYGLGLLTRETIVAQDTLRLETDLNARAAVHARLKTDALGGDRRVLHASDA